MNRTITEKYSKWFTKLEATNDFKSLMMINYRMNHIPHTDMFSKGYVDFYDNHVRKTDKYNKWINDLKAEFIKLWGKPKFNVNKVYLAKGQRTGRAPELICEFSDGIYVANDTIQLGGLTGYSSDSIRESSFAIIMFPYEFADEVARCIISTDYVSNIKKGVVMQDFFNVNSQGKNTPFSWFAYVLKKCNKLDYTMYNLDNLYSVPVGMKEIPADKLKEMGGTLKTPDTITGGRQGNENKVDTTEQNIIPPFALQKHFFPNATNIFANLLNGQKVSPEPLLNDAVRSYDSNTDDSVMPYIIMNLVDIHNGEIKYKEKYYKPMEEQYKQQFLKVLKENMDRYEIINYEIKRDNSDTTIQSISLHYEIPAVYGSGIKLELRVSGEEDDSNHYFSRENTSQSFIIALAHRYEIYWDLIKALSKATHCHITNRVLEMSLLGNVKSNDKLGCELINSRELSSDMIAVRESV